MTIRRRLTAILFGGSALGTTGYIAAVTVSTLAVEEITGRATLAGLPNSLAVLGTALGATLLTRHVARRGRRPGLLGGYGVGAIGGLIALTAIVQGWFVVLLAGMALLGIGHASNQLNRYAGAEMFRPERRASALSLIVWAGTVGSVLGPSLLAPSGDLSTGRGYPELAGGYLVAAVFMLAATILYAVALRPDPASLSEQQNTTDDVEDQPLGEAFRLPRVRMALAALVAGQVVMVLIMTATPLHIHHGGSDLGIVGLVMSAHTLGMFAFSPATGWLADRYGRDRTVYAGLAVLAVAALLATLTPAHSTGALIVALCLLGIGWNLCFVSASALLTLGFSPGLRVRVQGRADSVTWLSSATASLVSGIFFELSSYHAVALAGLALLVIPTAVVVRNRPEAVTA